MNYLSLFAIGVLLISSCKKEEEEPSEIPDCLDATIVRFDLTTACPYSAKVDRFTFQGETVFALDPGTCGADQMTDIIDSDCNTIGSLGGIAGNSIINGEDFSNAIYIETLWEDQ